MTEMQEGRLPKPRFHSLHEQALGAFAQRTDITDCPEADVAGAEMVAQPFEPGKIEEPDGFGVKKECRAVEAGDLVVELCHEALPHRRQLGITESVLEVLMEARRPITEHHRQGTSVVTAIGGRLVESTVAETRIAQPGP